MTVLLYAVTDGKATVEGVGLNQQPLREIGNRGLTAVVSDHDESPSTSEPNLWEYEQVVEQLMTAATVLPARFGATASSDKQIKAMLSDRREELKTTLDEVRGAVEIAIRAPVPQQPIADSVRTGTEYLEAQLQERRRARELLAHVELAVGSLARAKRRGSNSDNTAAYLVDHDKVDQFVAQLQQLERPEIAWTGPWPPYSFVNGTTQPR